jgi:hypothetical protein
MGAPTILALEVETPFSHLWLRTIQGLDLDQHCARAFIGPYLAGIKPDGLHQPLPIVMDAESARAYYLCGVTAPFVWSDNLHVAFVHSPGDTLEINEHGVHFVVQDARRLPIPPPHPQPEHAFGNLASYYTCRNWLFATWLSAHPEIGPSTPAPALTL